MFSIAEESTVELVVLNRLTTWVFTKLMLAAAANVDSATRLAEANGSMLKNTDLPAQIWVFILYICISET